MSPNTVPNRRSTTQVSIDLPGPTSPPKRVIDRRRVARQARCRTNNALGRTVRAPARPTPSRQPGPSTVAGERTEPVALRRRTAPNHQSDHQAARQERPQLTVSQLSHCATKLRHSPVGAVQMRVTQTHLPMSLEPFVGAAHGGAGYKERTGLECWSTAVTGRLRHVGEIPDERTAWQNS
jgi:hypothetical protein